MTSVQTQSFKGLHLASLNFLSANLLEKSRSAWLAGASMNDVLSRLVQETSARAAGCWRLNEDGLHLVGFGCASDMPLEVSQAFQEATKRVSLDQRGLGIVAAAQSDQPTIALLDPKTTGLDRSASWIARFDANSSLSVPIRDWKSQTLLGVFAVSTKSMITQGDALWNAMLQISQELGR